MQEEPKQPETTQPTPEPAKPEVPPETIALQFGFVGIGHGGSRIADAFSKFGYDACCINTTTQDFGNISIANKLLLKYNIGAGGKDIKIGRLAAEANRPDIYNLFKDTFKSGVDTLFVSIGGGGKTGTGGAPIVREEAAKFVEKELRKDIHIGMIYTLPRAREPLTVKDNAAKVLQEIKETVSPLILIDNQIVSEHFPAPITKFWTNANTQIAQIFDAFNVRSSAGGGIENFDVSEFRSVIEAGGCIVFGKTNIDKISRASDIAKTFENNLMNGMLYRFNRDHLRTAKRGGAIIVASEEALGSVMEDDLGYGFTVLSDIIDGGDIFSGIYIDNTVKGFDFYTILGGIEI